MSCLPDGARARTSANCVGASRSKTALAESKIALGKSMIALSEGESTTGLDESKIALGGSKSRTALDVSKRPQQQTTKTANHEDSLSFILASFPTDCYILSNGLSSGTCIVFLHFQRIALRNM